MFKNIYGWLDNNKKRYKSELEYRKIVDNIIWIIAGRFVRLGLGVIVASLVARHLGPLDYGRIVYVIAFVGLFSAFASFGLNGVVVRELVKSTENYGNILGASVVIQLIAGMISIVIITSGFFYSNDFSDQNLLFVGATILLFRVSDVIKYWYESQVLTKNVVMVETVSYFLVAIISIILIINNSHVIMFVLVTSVEGLIVLLLLFYMYSRSGYRISNWKVRYGEIKY